MRILVCGGRDMDPSDAWNWLEQNLAAEVQEKMGYWTFSVEAIIHGGARGADEGAARWGASEGAKVIAYPADWKKHGKAAGPIRNRQMLTEAKPDVVVALPGGRGTANMVRQANDHGVPVIEVRW